jgi:hypothetical protein
LASAGLAAAGLASSFLAGAGCATADNANTDATIANNAFISISFRKLINDKRILPSTYLTL